MQIRAQFSDLFLTSMLPALDELIWQKFDPHPPSFTKVFRVMSSSRSIEQTTQLSGLGTFATIAEGADMVYDQPVQGYDKTYTHAQYGNGFRMTRVMIDDDKHSIAKKNAMELGRGARETLELSAWSILNNAFTGGSTAGPDGVALCSASHPQIKAGGTQSNTLSVAADLDIASLELALTQFRNFKDSAGKFIRVMPRKLLVSPSDEFNAAEILSGTMRSDTANNTQNAFRHRDGLQSFSDYMVSEYLTDTDAWFVLADKSDTELRFYWREKPVTLHDTDFDSRSIKTAMWMRFSYGFSDYLGVFGSPGA